MFDSPDDKARRRWGELLFAAFFVTLAMIGTSFAFLTFREGGPLVLAGLATLIFGWGVAIYHVGIAWHAFQCHWDIEGSHKKWAERYDAAARAHPKGRKAEAK